MLIICNHLRDGLTKKTAVLLDFFPNYLPSPQFGQLVQILLNVKNVDLSDIQNGSLSKRQNTYFVGHVYNLKQFKVQIIGILEEIDSSY